MENARSNKRAFLGVILVLVGFVLIASNLNLFPFGLRPIIFSWPALLILIGLFFLLSREAKATGWVLILIGGLFIVPRVYDVPWNWHQIFWPSLLLGLGVILIVRSLTRRQVPVGDGPDFLDDVNIFGGGDRILTSQQFKGGRITAIFGGSKYNMTKAELARGRNEIDIFTMFGGCKFVMPDDWEVKVEISAIFGGFSDKRHITRDTPRDPSRELVIKGVAIFGGGDIVSF